jgi:hypothetical protein
MRRTGLKELIELNKQMYPEALKKMNPKTFVELIKMRAVDAAVRGTMETLSRPAGRKPKQELVELSEWFNRLSPVDRTRVEETARYATDLAVYNFLGVLDGIAFFGSPDSQGKLELYYDDGKARILLNDDRGAQLTSLFKDLS